MKYVFVILVFAGVLLQNFSKIYIIINFKLNQEYIAKNLCVKKAVVNNCCQGNCHMNKQLAAEDKKEKSPVNNLKQVKDFQLFFNNVNSIAFNSATSIKPDFLSYQFSKGTQLLKTVFHPPC